jgi:hypothetical protein
MTTETLKQRIERERRELGLKPWQFAPSQVDDGPSLYPPGSAGHPAWLQAQAWRAEIRAKKPGYFDECEN